MEERETQHRQPLNLCRFLYTFFMKFFARKTLRAVPLKTPPSNHCTELPIYDSSPPRISSTIHQTEQINGCQIADHRAAGKGSPPVWIPINDSAPEKGKEEEEEAKAPKKMVSINENVEDINTILKQRRESKPKEADSFGRQQEQDHHPKRLKSILRVGSDLNDTFHSVLS